MLARGTFTIEMTPQPDDAIATGRMLIEKQFEGDMQGASQGQMLSQRCEKTGSAVYVALETFVGKIGVLSGSISFYHTGVMNRGEGVAHIAVVPDSGSGDFTGMTGTLSIEPSAAHHHYQLAYRVSHRS